jgi:hypothetical protein
MNDAFGRSFIISKLCYLKSLHTWTDDGLLSLKQRSFVLHNKCAVVLMAFCMITCIQT